METARDQIGFFHVTALLDEGGMGVVCAFVDPDLEGRVAIKVIRRDLLADVPAR